MLFNIPVSYTHLDVYKRQVLGRPVNKAETEARPGDVAGAYASCDRAKNLIGWEAQYSIEDGIRDAFRLSLIHI